MLRGQLYNPMEPELVAARRHARELTKLYNISDDLELPVRARLLERLFGYVGENVVVEPPFFCDYGKNITIGNGVFLNFNCVILDVTPVTIGDRVLFGPAVQLLAATHPLSAEERRTGLELGAPISIGDDCWFGGGVIVLPGVRIGARCVIGAGAVVTRDVEDDVVVAGNPANVVRRLK